MNFWMDGWMFDLMAMALASAGSTLYANAVTIDFATAAVYSMLGK